VQEADKTYKYTMWEKKLLILKCKANGTRSYRWVFNEFIVWKKTPELLHI